MFFLRMMRSRPIHGKLFMLIFLAFLPGAGIITANGLRESKEQLENAKHEAMLLAESLASQQEQLVVGTKQMLSTLARLPQVQNLDGEACSRLFRELRDQHPFYSGMSAVTPDGNVFANVRDFVPGTVNFSSQKHVRDALESREFSAGEYMVGRLSNVPSIFYSYPVLDNQRHVTAILNVGFNLEEYKSFIGKATLPERSIVAIMDHRGIRLFRTPENDAAAVGKHVSEKALTALLGARLPGSFESVGTDGVDRFYTFKPLRLREGSPPYLYIVVGIPRDIVYHRAYPAILRNLSFLAFAAAVSMGVAWLFGRFVFLIPIKKLVEAARRIGTGDLKARTGLPHSTDELGQLSESFDQMAGLLEMRSLEYRTSEEALRQSEERHRNISSSISDFAFSCTKLGGGEYEIDWLAGAVETITGYSIQELMDRRCWRFFVHPEDMGVFDENVIGPEPGRSTQCELRILHKDGATRWIRTATRIIESEGVPGCHRLFGGCEDITERKRSEEEREKLREQLNQAQKLEAVGRLAGGVAHDFNNMLSIIIGHAEMLLDEIAPGDPFHHDVMEIKNAGQRSADLTRQLLAFARKQTISPKILDLNETAGGILKMLRRLIGEDIELIWKPGPDVWRVEMDPGQVDQLLANLAVNARDAIAGVGSLTIETANVVFDESYCHTRNELTPGSYVLLAVSDTGSGMDKATLDRIFEPFFTTKGLGKGTGLGLATVYGIVKQNRGFINVYSEPGHGTTFKIYLPRAQEQAEEISTPVINKDLSGTETVLLVEDEESILSLGKSILERRGYVVLASQSPREALTMAQVHPGPIHLLITDVVMPEMNGKDLRDKLTAVKPGVKCIFMSGYTANVIAHHGVLDKGIDFLQKPFSVKTLAEKVREVLDA